MRNEGIKVLKSTNLRTPHSELTVGRKIMLRVGENLNVMVKKIGAAMKERDPSPFKSWPLRRPRRG